MDEIIQDYEAGEVSNQPSHPDDVRIGVDKLGHDVYQRKDGTRYAVYPSATSTSYSAKINPNANSEWQDESNIARDENGRRFYGSTPEEAQANYEYYKYQQQATHGGWNGWDMFNATTGGIFNQLSPTQFGRNLYNIATGNPNYAQEWVYGNNGLVSDEFAADHPWLSLGINLTGDAVTLGGPSAVAKVYNIGKNLYTKGPKYIFDNLPYKTIYNVQKAASNIKSDAITFFRTPMNENPIKAVRNRRQSLQVGKTPRTDIQYDNNVYYNTNKSSIQNINDPISQIRGRLRTRMNNGDYQYSYPNDGIGISPDKNMYNPDYIISQIPVKDYLSLRDVYKMGIDRHSGLMDKISNAIQTPIHYLKANTEPAFAYTGGNRFIKVNKKAIKDLGFDYPTALSHEYNHVLRNEFIGDGKLQRHLGFNYDHLAPQYKKYLSSPTEIEARGTQLKNYFNSDVITPDMLKYAAKHYVLDTNMDNNMYQFFSGIKDWNLAADYLSKFSLKNGGKM